MERIEVSKEEFYTKLNASEVDIILSIVDHKYPYTTVFKSRHLGNEFGRAVDAYSPGGVWPIITTYFLNSDFTK